MLVLSRHEGEAIVLETSDGPITVRLTEYIGSQTCAGVDAPTPVRVLREALVEEREPG